MFFPEKITSIAEGDKVLEVGPGADPYHRSDVLLELEYDNEEDKIAQFGHANPLVTNKKVVFYDGKKFPFADKEFDYIICSHVLEHVDDVEFFLSEVFRVAKRGYFEFPLLPYEYLYNIEAHLNYLKFENERLLLMRKNKSSIAEFKEVNLFLLETLRKGYSHMIVAMPHVFIQGFEWKTPFKIEQVENLSLFMPQYQNHLVEYKIAAPTVKSTSKLLLSLLKKKILKR